MRSPFEGGTVQGMFRRTARRFDFTVWLVTAGLVAVLPPARGESPDENAVAVSPAGPLETAAGAARKLPKKVSFNAHIRPIMSNTCFVCHGPDENANESGLRLDSFESAVHDGGVIKPGDGASSTIIRRITNAEDPMPPADFRHQLSDYDKALFQRWIEQGAEYEKHWSFAPLERPSIPQPVRYADKVANEIDAFVLARLERENIAPSESADRATLLRRVSLDLIGLPPTIQELDRFLSDDTPDAYRHQVERLLASPHYGERMAPLWLDIVRFSDTVGFHGDQNQRIYPYRDYVIQSLNHNMPFDRFTREQLSGDLLENPTPQQLAATGLIRLNMMTREGGAQPNEYLAKYTADRVRMVGTAWLGATTACCECHNHKYDPYTIEDFYSLGAFFDDVRQWGVYTTYGYTPNPDLNGFSNNHPFPPEMRISSDSAMDQIEYLERALDQTIASELGDGVLATEKFRSWIKSTATFLAASPDGWMPLDVVEVDSTENTPSSRLPDGSVLFTGKPRKQDKIAVAGAVPFPMVFRAIRLEVIPDAANGGFVGRSPDGRFATGLSLSVERDRAGEESKEPNAGAAESLKIDFAQADRLNPNSYQSGFEPSRLKGDWRSGPAPWQLPYDETSFLHTAVYHLESGAPLGKGDRLKVQIRSDDIGRIRLSVSPLTRFVAGIPASRESFVHAVKAYESGKELTERQRASLFGAFHLATTVASQLSPAIISHRDAILDLRSGHAMTMVAQQADPGKRRKSRVLPRGDWQDESGESVFPATPAFLPRLSNSEGRPLTRRDLADWLTGPENPLAARHFVNRMWRHLFGAGLSSKLEDLGNQGEWPSHPSLLDWLAVEFREEWDRKHIVRLIVMSNTYKQRAAHRRELLEIDPYNRMLAQQSARRLEAETIRDNALAISGLLMRELIGGPSVLPYQPDGHYDNLQFPARPYKPTKLALQYRRGVYVHWQRTFLHPMLVNFDAPSRDECVAERTFSNSPQQALTMLNDPQFIEAGNAFAHFLVSENPRLDFPGRLRIAFRRALAREASSEEERGLRRLFQNQRDYYRSHTEEAEKLLTRNGDFQPSRATDSVNAVEFSDFVELAAWSHVCRVILNLHETITRF